MIAINESTTDEILSRIAQAEVRICADRAERMARRAEDLKITLTGFVEKCFVRGGMTEAERDEAIAKINAGQEAFESCETPVAVLERSRPVTGVSFAALADPDQERGATDELI